MENKKKVIERCEKALEEFNRSNIHLADLEREVKALKEISEATYIKYGNYTKWELVKIIEDTYVN